jgi:hypothetical protein
MMEDTAKTFTEMVQAVEIENARLFLMYLASGFERLDILSLLRLNKNYDQNLKHVDPAFAAVMKLLETNSRLTFHREGKIMLEEALNNKAAIIMDAIIIDSSKDPDFYKRGDKRMFLTAVGIRNQIRTKNLIRVVGSHRKSDTGGDDSGENIDEEILRKAGENKLKKKEVAEVPKPKPFTLMDALQKVAENDTGK